MESVIQGLQKWFLHTLMHHRVSNKFDTTYQGMKTIQDMLNELKKYSAQMIHLPGVYTFHKWFVSALHNTLCNEVLKKGYTANLALSSRYLKLLE